MNAKVALLLVLTLCAFALAVTATFNWSVPRLYAFSNGVTENDDQPPQPTGDPIDDDVPVPVPH